MNLKSSTLESDIEQKTVDRAKKLGAWGVKLLKSIGLPDRVFVFRGGILFIEFKRPGYVATPAQRAVHNKLRSLGYRVEIHDSVNSAVSAIKKAMDAARVPEGGTGPADDA